MPLQCACPRCYQVLSIEGRRTGDVVDCPGCAVKIRLPDLDALRAQSEAHDAAPPTPRVPTEEEFQAARVAALAEVNVHFGDLFAGMAAPTTKPIAAEPMGLDKQPAITAPSAPAAKLPLTVNRVAANPVANGQPAEAKKPAAPGKPVANGKPGIARPAAPRPAAPPPARATPEGAAPLARQTGPQKPAPPKSSAPTSSTRSSTNLPLKPESKPPAPGPAGKNARRPSGELSAKAPPPPSAPSDRAPAGMPRRAAPTIKSDTRRLAGSAAPPAAPVKPPEQRATSAPSNLKLVGEASSAVRSNGFESNSEGQDDFAPLPEDGRVLIARWVLFAQGALIAIAAVGGFAAGFLFGRGVPALPTGASHANLAKVLVEGRVVYHAVDQSSAPDVGSVVIALPAAAAPSEKIRPDGLRPEDPPPAENNSQVRIIESLDGAYARVDATGRFHFTAAPGDYLVLVVSRHEVRPVGDEPNPEDMAQLEQFFSPASALIGQARHKLVERRLSENGTLENQSLEIDF